MSLCARPVDDYAVAPPPPTIVEFTRVWTMAFDGLLEGYQIAVE
jgi:hypothetical protein